MVKKVVFLGMGGTIAGHSGSAADNVGYKAAQVGVSALLDAVPGLQAILGNRLAVSEQVCQIDSKDLAYTDWMALLERAVHYLSLPDVVGVVVTHGTDTLEETAFFLDQAMPPHLLKSKAILLTCAMRPASSFTPDGPGNMADAVSVALHDGACGVLVVCSGKIHRAAHVQKVHPYRVDAFDSGEAGALGMVEEGRVRLQYAWPPGNAGKAQLDVQKMRAQGWPRVELVTSHAGASGSLVRALLINVDGGDPLRGIVVACTGNGTIHKDLEAALLDAQQLGVRVVRVSRCAYGQIVDGGGSGGFAYSALSGVKARIALALELSAQS